MQLTVYSNIETVSYLKLMLKTDDEKMVCTFLSILIKCCQVI